MFGDEYILKIGAETEKQATLALFAFVLRQYQAKAGLDHDGAASLAAAVTNKVFGKVATGDANKAFAAANAPVIEDHARRLASDDNLCAVLSGAAYNICYARYVSAGGRRSMFSNAFLAYIRTLSRGDSYKTECMKFIGQITSLGQGILDPIQSMLRKAFENML